MFNVDYHASPACAQFACHVARLLLTQAIAARGIRQALHNERNKGSIVDVVGCGDGEERASRLGDALGGALGLSHTVGH
jgi:hypothetical protein